MKLKTFSISILSYSSHNILKIDINGCGYEYDISPFLYEKFENLLQHNKGRALSLIRGSEI